MAYFIFFTITVVNKLLLFDFNHLFNKVSTRKLNKFNKKTLSFYSE